MISESDDVALAPIITPAPRGRPGAEPYPREFDERQGLGLWECWLTVRKRLGPLLGLTASALTLALLAILVQTPRYTATATVLIQPETPEVLDVTQLVATTPNSDEHDFYKTQEDLLQSPALAAKVIQALA